MPATVIMPALELAQETGKVLRWLKAAGEAVVKGEPIVEIETDKITVEIEAPASGVLRDVAAREVLDAALARSMRDLATDPALVAAFARATAAAAPAR